MDTQRQTCIHPRKTAARHGPSPRHLAIVRGAVAAAALRFGVALSAACIEDVAQDTFLRLWKTKAGSRLNHLPYLRRAAANTTVDLLRYQSAQKRTLPRELARDLALAFWAPPRTPEDILIAREEAYRSLASDPRLRKRVGRAMRRLRANHVTH